MPKYSKVYLRNKKESNVSMPLRFSFLKSIFVDGMSVKNVSPPSYLGCSQMENALLHSQNHSSVGP
jgi:hypothetical protein